MYADVRPCTGRRPAPRPGPRLAPGLEQLAISGKAVDAGVSVAIGAIAGLAQSNTNYGGNVSGTQAYEQGVANSLSQTSLHILDRYLNILPILTIREGHRIKVYLTQDLMLPAFDKHVAEVEPETQPAKTTEQVEHSESLRGFLGVFFVIATHRP